MSYLPILRENELFAFQKSGNFNNWKFSITKAPNDNLLPVSFKIENGGTITTFEARKVSILVDTITTINTVNLLALATIDKTGDFYSIAATEGLPSNLENGIYYYYFSDGANIRKSDLFCVDGTIQDFVNEWENELGVPFFNELNASFITI